MMFLSNDPIYKKLLDTFNRDTQLAIYHFALICQPAENLMEYILKRENMIQIFIQPYNSIILRCFEGRINISPTNFIRYSDIQESSNCVLFPK